jgi:hypothetical protein
MSSLDPSPTEAVNKDGGGAVLRREVRQAQAKPTGSDRPFAIMRYAKLRSTRSITGSAQHMRRSHPTPNADPALTSSNKILIGSADPAADVLQLLPPEGSRDMSGKLRRRSNSVLAVEVLMTASPEWWATATPEQRADWVDQSRAWLELEWCAENVAHLELHGDEKTPHLTGLIVPLDDSGHLNARAWIGGKASKRDPGSSLLSGHQTRYAEAVEDLGLRRGIMGSTARHTPIQAHYKALAKAEEATPPELGTPPLLGRRKWGQRAAEAIQAHTATLAAQASELPIERQRRIAAERTAEQANQRAEEAKAARRAMADEMRALPLADVLKELGLAEVRIAKPGEPADPGVWKMGAKGERTHRITLKDRQWFDHVAQKGRAGSIDLVQHVMGTDFNGALSWLADRFGKGAAAAEYRNKARDNAEPAVERAVEERAPFSPPAPDAEAWPMVRRHLVEDRAIPADLVDAAHEAGNVYAMSHPGRGNTRLRNAVFIQRDMSGEAVGAELKGIVRGASGKHWSGLAPGSSKSAGVFRVGVELLQAASVFVVESAIDALSLAARIRDRMRGTFTVISTAGDNTMPEVVLEDVHRYAKRYAAQDRNAAGDRQAKRLGEGWERVKPPEPYEDWNEELVAKAGAGSVGEAGHVTPGEVDLDRDLPDSFPSL